MKSFEELKALAESVYEQARDAGKERAVIVILEALSTLYAEAQSEMLARVEHALASK